MVVAPITNALWLFGSIALAISLKRAGHVPRWVYLGLPIVWVGSIPLGTLGGGLIAGAYWLAVGYLLADGSLEIREPSQPPPPPDPQSARVACAAPVARPVRR